MNKLFCIGYNDFGETYVVAENARDAIVRFENNYLKENKHDKDLRIKSIILTSDDILI